MLIQYHVRKYLKKLANEREARRLAELESQVKTVKVQKK